MFEVCFICFAKRLSKGSVLSLLLPCFYPRRATHIRLWLVSVASVTVFIVFSSSTVVPGVALRMFDFEIRSTIMEIERGKIGARCFPLFCCRTTSSVFHQVKGCLPLLLVDCHVFMGLYIYLLWVRAELSVCPLHSQIINNNNCGLGCPRGTKDCEKHEGSVWTRLDAWTARHRRSPAYIITTPC